MRKWIGMARVGHHTLAAIVRLAMGFAVACCVIVTMKPAVADTKDKLVGTWKIVSWVSLGGGKHRGADWKGHIIFTTDGRVLELVTEEGRTERVRREQPLRPGQECFTLLHSAVAYSGRYRVEFDRIITKVETAVDENIVGMEEGRRFSLEGDTLRTVSVPTPGMGAIITDIKTWQREK